jgi:hypothetical protein
MRMPPHTQRGLATVLLAVGAATCVGRVGENSARDTQSGRMQPGAPGPEGTGGSSAGPKGDPMVAAPGTPGRVTLHRLNRLEYDNTVRDLLDVDLRPSVTYGFTEDEFGEGFDNNADVLTLSPIDGENYLKAARELVAKALEPGTAPRARLVICDPAADEAGCGLKILTAFGRRAFRRPVTDAELKPYTGLITLVRSKGDDFERGLRLALQAMLVAPDFLFRVEVNPAPGVTQRIDDWELASRLSYFLWSTMPDEPLFAAAAAGTLGKPEQTAAQVKRMLADPRADNFAHNLGRQWLQLAELAKKSPDPRLFPGFSEALRLDMESEAEAFFVAVAKGQAGALDLLTGNYAFLNKRLAQHYGLTELSARLGDKLERVALDSERRGGVLRQAAFLTLTSHPDGNAPVKRGKWVLERLLCDPPPPKPGNVPNFEPGAIPQGSLRQKLEAAHHSRGPVCASCHQGIDGVGFAFEHYDATGAWRDDDNGYPIDDSGTLPGTDVKFTGAAALTAALAADKRFPLCVARKVFGYALGRGMTDGDGRVLAEAAAKFAAQGHALPSLVEQVVTSAPFTTQRGEP